MASWTPASFEEIVGHVEAGRLDLEAWSSALDGATIDRFLDAAEAALADLPVPIGVRARGPVVDRRRAIDRLVGRLRARRGEFEALVRAERDAWLRGGSHLGYMEVLRDSGRATEAAVLARTLLAKDGCAERGELEDFLKSLSSPPQGWEEAVVDLADDPSIERWESLWRFTPEEVYEERVRYTLLLLRRMGVDPDRLFELATSRGVMPDAIELVETGSVSPRTIEERALRAPGTARAIWLGLAARAAMIRGDRFGTVRLLKAAYETHHPEFPPMLDLEFVREHADAELQSMLDRAGLP